MQDRSGSVKRISNCETDPRTTIMIGASKTYESYGVECIARRFKLQGIRVGAISGVTPESTDVSYKS